MVKTFWGPKRMWGPGAVAPVDPPLSGPGYSWVCLRLGTA